MRNAGSGIAVLDRWNCREVSEGGGAPTDIEEFHRLIRDLYIPAGDVGYWQGAIRDRTDPGFDLVRDLVGSRQAFLIDVLYGDYEGGQRTISCFALTALSEDRWLAQVVRHWNVDRDDPR